MSSGDPGIGREIGSYRIEELLGQGGMGKVYRARHPAIGKQVAIKLLLPEFSSRPDVVMRFFHEARSVNDIRHENLVDIIDFGETKEGERYILMEYLEGESLTSALKRDAPFPPIRIGHIGLQICSALYAAHEAGIIHRDIKSDNIFLTEKAGQPDFVKVLDFGIAKLHDVPEDLRTKSGAILGTPLYMSPEQALGARVDHLTDIYALGVLFYQMATGQPPFYHTSPVALASMHITAKIPSLRERNPDVDPKLEKVIVKCLAKEKKDRYQSMKELAQALGDACGLSLDGYFKLSAAPVSALAPTAPQSFPGATSSERKEGLGSWWLAIAGGGLSVLLLGAFFLSGTLWGGKAEANHSNNSVFKEKYATFEDPNFLPGARGECSFKDEKHDRDGYKLVTFVLETVPAGAQVFDNQGNRLCEQFTTPLVIGLYETTEIVIKKDGYLPYEFTVLAEQIPLNEDKIRIVTIKLSKAKQ